MKVSMAVAAVVCAFVGSIASGVLAQGNHEQTVERFVLTGVIFSGGASGVAWLQEPILTGDRPMALRPGESIGPYRLTGVFEDRVELEGPKGRILVPLRNPQGAPATAVASVAPGASAAVGSGTGVLAAVPPASSEPPPTMSPRPLSGRERWEARGMQRRRQSQQVQPQAAQPEQGQPQQGRAQQRQVQQGEAQQGVGVGPSGGSAVSVANQADNAPHVIFLGPDDPLRKQSFQSMIGVGK
jgi:hypothetical protein